MCDQVPGIDVVAQQCRCGPPVADPVDLVAADPRAAVVADPVDALDDERLAVQLDAAELFRSEEITDSTERALDIDISEVDLLELVVETTEDGPSSDWGIWFSPQLAR